MVSSYALILTGEVLPGFLPDAVWPQLAAEVRIEPEQFAQLLAQTPRTIKQDDDAGKLQKLQEDIAKIGAQTEICLTDGQPALYVQVNGTPRGPVPRTLVEQRVQRGHWPETIAVAEVGAEKWHTFREYVAVIAHVAPIAPIAPQMQQPAAPVYATAVRDDDDNPALAGAKYLAAGKGELAASMESDANTEARRWKELPESDAIYAGFWRRVAAYQYDALRFWATSIPIYVVALPLRILLPFWGAVFRLLALGGLWFWYYPWKEGNGWDQATFGKRACGIKVVDRHGGPIGLGRSLWRQLSQFLLPLVVGVYFMNSVVPATKDPSVFFKFSFLTNLIAVYAVMAIVLVLPYMLAGWTRRKQTLYDMMAGAFVVFDEVQPGQRLPRQRPPMPWFGGGLNILAVLSMCVPLALSLAGIREIPAWTVFDAASSAQVEAGTLGDCRTGERLLPKPVLGKAVTSGIPGACKTTITLDDSVDMPAGMRGGTIEFTSANTAPGTWSLSCAANMPGKYLTLMLYCRRW